MAELDLEHFLPYRLSVLSNRVSQGIARTYEERFGLSVTEWRVIAIIGRYPGLSATEVAQRSAMDKVAISRAVRRLLDQGRIEREHNDADRRARHLRLSDAGRAISRRNRAGRARLRAPDQGRAERRGESDAGAVDREDRGGCLGGWLVGWLVGCFLLGGARLLHGIGFRGHPNRRQGRLPQLSARGDLSGRACGSLPWLVSLVGDCLFERHIQTPAGPPHPEMPG